MLLLALVVSTTAQAQTADTLTKKRPLFTAGDAVLVAGFTAAAAAAAPADRYFTQQLQDPARQANRIFNRGATIFRLIGQPGGLVTGSGLYLFGLARGNRRIEDLGLHTVESVMLASGVTGTIKVVAGRARPRRNPDNAADFQLLRGLKGDDYQSFPSGHATAAFAFAAIMSAETSHWWPDTRWTLGPVLYGSAALTGVSRIYNDAHWASDVLAGAAIGTLTGLKIFRYQHSHPNNRLDRFFLRAGVQLSNNGAMDLILSPVP